MLYKAVLFDLDGTLLDTLDDIGESLNRALKKEGFPIQTREAYSKFVGEGATLLVTRALPEEKRDEDTIRSCLKVFLEDYNEHWKINTKPYDGVPEMLDSLSARGLKMTVLSNKAHFFTERCVVEFLSDWNFDVVFGQRDGVPKKPDPAGALEVAERLGFTPGDFLYLGDTGIDMKTAVAAAMYPVGVLWGFRTLEELQSNGARTVIRHPLEVLSLLDEQ